MSSLENISSEAIQCLAFADSYTKKSGKFILSLSEFIITLRNYLKEKLRAHGTGKIPHRK